MFLLGQSLIVQGWPLTLRSNSNTPSKFQSYEPPIPPFLCVQINVLAQVQPFPYFISWTFQVVRPGCDRLNHPVVVVVAIDRAFAFYTYEKSRGVMHFYDDPSPEAH